MTDNFSIAYFIDYWGMMAPAVLFIISIFLLQNKMKYLLVYIIGTILNNILNAILKYAIKEPRPTKESRILEIAISNYKRVSFDKYGMPSAHAQNCGFNLAFITLVLNNSFITGLYLVISFISLYQRYKYSKHTILQLIIGFIIGIGFGYMIYHVVNKWIKGNLTMKFDDFAPK
jgi:membrane-associated phospholipid phosphatase